MKRSKLLTIPRAATRMLPAPTHLRRLFVALVALLTMTAQTAWADDVSITADGSTISEETIWTDCTVNVTGSGTVTFSNRITISGTVTLNLGTGATLTANNGITVHEGNSLTIDGEGTLYAYGSGYGAGIGSVNNCSAGTIIINGGTVNAYGKGDCAGIGGGEKGNGGNITINGGTVNAESKDSGWGAGIGGGMVGDGGIITINGGDINAKSAYGTGIGGGYKGNGGTITITGGNVTATAGYDAAGIGGGCQCNGGTITITGGIINVAGGNRGAGIGGGGTAISDVPAGSGGTIAISGGQITVTSDGCYGIGAGKSKYGNDGAEGTITLSWTDATDFISASSYVGDINFSANKRFYYDGTEDYATAEGMYKQERKIVPAVVNNSSLSYGEIRMQRRFVTTEGTAVDVSYKVFDSEGNKLTLGTDYTAVVKNSSNETVTNLNHLGDYTLTITGTGTTYTGSKSFAFSLVEWDTELTQDGSEYYVNLPENGTTKTVYLNAGQSIKVYDSAGKNGSLVTSDGCLMLYAPDGYALEVTGKTDAMRYNTANSLWVNSLSAYEGDSFSNEIFLLQTNSDNILFASGGNVMLMRLNVPALYTFEPQYGLDLTVRVIPQQSYTITKGTVSNGSIDIADNKTTANTNEMITLTVNPAEGYLLKRITITDTDGGSTIQTIGEDQWYSGDNTISFKMPNKNVTITPEFTNDLTASGLSTISISPDGVKECVIPEGVTSFNIGGSPVTNGASTTVLQVPNGYRLQATGNVKFYGNSYDNSELSIYDGADTSATLLKKKIGYITYNNGNTDIGTQISSSNYMTIYLYEQDIYNVSFTGKINMVYSIDYDLAGGSVAIENPATYTYDTNAFTLTNPTREGYEFAGWTGTGLDAASTSVTIATGSTGNREYTATWTPITYNITYTNAVNGTDGVTNTNPTTYTIESEAITLADPSKTGYVFAGWFSDAEFNTAATTTITKGTIGNKTFWAKWTRLITSEGITISIPSQEWTGNALTPVITVTDGTNLLTETTDYTVTAPSGPIQDAGDYTYTITGAGNYSGETTATFTITQKAVTITLTGEYGTYCSTVDLDFSEATGLTAYIAAGYNKSEGSLLMVKVTSVPAGTGLLLKGTAGSTYTAKGKTSPYVYSNLLTGTTAETTVSTSDFILGKNGDKVGFYRAGDGTLAAGKAYLKGLPTPSGARIINLVFDDDATAIENYRQEASTTNDWYTLDGRKLEGKPTRKGLYVKNGKKVVVR